MIQSWENRLDQEKDEGKDGMHEDFQGEEGIKNVRKRDGVPEGKKSVNQEMDGVRNDWKLRKNMRLGKEWYV